MSIANKMYSAIVKMAQSYLRTKLDVEIAVMTVAHIALQSDCRKTRVSHSLRVRREVTLLHACL